jgi:hypothetical protein
VPSGRVQFAYSPPEESFCGISFPQSLRQFTDAGFAIFTVVAFTGDDTITKAVATIVIMDIFIKFFII